MESNSVSGPSTSVNNSGYSTRQNNIEVNQLALTDENLDFLVQPEYVLKSGYEGISPAPVATSCSAQGNPSCSPNRHRQLALTEDNLDFFLQQEYRSKKNGGNNSSSDGLSSGAMDVSDFSPNEHNRSALTEENLDFFLQQEYALSDTCYDTEKMSLNEYEVAQDTELVEDDVKESSNTEDTDMEELGCSSKIEHDKKPELPTTTEGDGELIKKSFKELFNTDLAPGIYYEVYSSSHAAAPQCTIELNKSLVVPMPPVTAMLPNITKRHSYLFELPKNEEPPDTEEQMETNSDVSNVSKNSTKNDNGNSYSKDIVVTSNKIQNIQISQHIQKIDNLEALVSNAFKEKIPFSNVMCNKTYQSLNISIKSFPSREPTGLNKIANDLAPQEKKIVCRNQDLFSVRDLALASTSSDDIKFIDTDEDCLEPAICHIAYHKTDHDDSKVFKTLFNRSISVENISRVFIDSPSLFFYDKRFEGVVPSKSNLKRKSAQLNSKNNKLKKAGLKFTNVTIFYFERSQGFTSIPSKGGSTLGMESHHFYITTIPIDEYEYKKIKKEPSSMKVNHIIYHTQNGISDKPKNVQALSITQRIQLLELSDIQIELKEEDDCAYIRSSRAAAGCDCKDYCDPEICSCSMAGIECQVDRPNFPCGCTYENCKNVVGRNEYNHNSVKTHFIKTMRKIKSENKARISKRKQPLPTKILNNSDIIDNVIQI